jgi:hypothetical protein
VDAASRLRPSRLAFAAPLRLAADGKRGVEATESLGPLGKRGTLVDERLVLTNYDMTKIMPSYSASKNMESRELLDKKCEEKVLTEACFDPIIMALNLLLTHSFTFVSNILHFFYR